MGSVGALKTRDLATMEPEGLACSCPTRELPAVKPVPRHRVTWAIVTPAGVTDLLEPRRGPYEIDPDDLFCSRRSTSRHQTI